MPSPLLKKSDYQELLNSISEILTRSSQAAALALNKLRLAAYWEIGRRIVKVEQANNLRAAYGERLLVHLSAGLTQKFGNGFSVSNLKYMRQFYVSFPIRQTSGELPWSHYQVLSTIKDRGTRAKFTSKAAKHGWSVRELRIAIKEEGIELEAVGRPLLEPKPGGEPWPEPVTLKATLGKLYTYRLKFAPAALTLYPGDESRTGKYLVDLGFSVSRDVGTRGLKSVKNEMLVESIRTKDGYSLKESGAKPSDLFTFEAYLERVVDGDTLLCWIDLGFETWTSQKLRLRGINCPELTTQKGQQVKSFVESELKAKPLLIRTHKADKYDRYLVDVFYQPSAASNQLSVAESRELKAESLIYLNQALLDKGLAGVWKK